MAQNVVSLVVDFSWGGGGGGGGVNSQTHNNSTISKIKYSHYKVWFLCESFMCLLTLE